MIAGMIDEIASMLDLPKTSIVGAASPTAIWFKRKHSPSRFRGFGALTMQSLSTPRTRKRCCCDDRARQASPVAGRHRRDARGSRAAAAAAAADDPSTRRRHP